jgi:DNA-binding response OmpR family regulator
MSPLAPVVLLLEPDVAARYPLAEYLRECGYKVIEATSTDEASVLVEGHVAAIDAALLVATAGGRENAFSLAQSIRKSRADINVIMVGSTDSAVNEARQLCSAGPSLPKPYDHAQVLDLIKSSRAARHRAP